MADLHDPVELTDRQYREVVAYCSGVVEVDTAGDRSSSFTWGTFSASPPAVWSPRAIWMVYIGS